jgi:hypothetical protein
MHTIDAVIIPIGENKKKSARRSICVTLNIL